MNLLVLGATGGTGMELVRQAIDRGHCVTAFVRSPDRLKPFGDQLTIRQGDLLNPRELKDAVEGKDAVLSGFGPRLPISKADKDLLQRSAATLRTATANAGVRRVIVESTAFLFKESLMPPAYLFGRLLFPQVVDDAAATEGILRQSELDWTIVRPPQLIDRPGKRKYRVREDHLPAFGFKIARADVADFMLKTAETKASARKIFGISN